MGLSRGMEAASCANDALSCIKCPEDDIWKRTVLANRSDSYCMGETSTHPKGFYFTRTWQAPAGTVGALQERRSVLKAQSPGHELRNSTNTLLKVGEGCEKHLESAYLFMGFSEIFWLYTSAGFPSLMASSDFLG